MKPPERFPDTTPGVITVRPEEPPDEAFLFELYASTRQEELDAWGWPPEMQSAFLTLQFKASQGRHSAYPDAEFQIVLLDGANAGRLIVNRTQEELQLVDIALLPTHRNAGVGTALLQRIFGEAAATRKPLRLLLLQVHDELVFDAHHDEAEELKSLVRERMEGAMELAVPLVVDMALGKNWLEAH